MAQDEKYFEKTEKTKSMNQLYFQFPCGSRFGATDGQNLIMTTDSLLYAICYCKRNNLQLLILP
jgi:hypothetical protein